MLSVTKIISFAAAHRLINYDGPCAEIHGHNYKVEVTIACVSSHDYLKSERDSMLLDFKKVKRLIEEQILSRYDHALIISEDDPDIDDFRECSNMVAFPGNPTAESMCYHFAKNLDLALKVSHGTSFFVAKVRVWETDTSYAEITHSSFI